MTMNPGELQGVLSKSLQNCVLVEPEVKVELCEQSKDVPFETNKTSVLSLSSSACTKVSVTSSIERNRLQSQLVKFIAKSPVAIKAEKNDDADEFTEYTAHGDQYVIEESRNEVNISLKTHIKSEPTTSESEADKPLNILQDSEPSEDTIKEENFAETESLIEEVDIKSEDEESDTFYTKPTEVEGENWHLTSNKTGSPTDLNQTDINSRRLCIDESSVYKCFKCSYQTHRKRNLSVHLRKHKEMTFTCLHCSYKTWNSWDLKKHQIIHTSKQEVESHQCPKCPFTSKWKTSLTTHLSVHKNLNDVTWFQCPECPYKTRTSRLLKSHQLVHVPDKEVKLHKCPKCPFTSKWRNSLTTHLLVHRNVNEITWFQCPECPYKTWTSRLLKSHQLVHVPETEVKLHKCPKCLFASKWKNSLTTHLLAHKNLNVITWYHCPECPYKTKRKQYLIHNHMLKHNGKDVLINKCILYSYELPIK